MDVAVFKDCWTTLAPREREVMEQVAMGRSNPQIADLFGLSRKTIENTIVRANKRFPEKLSRTEFVRLWSEARG